METKTQQMKKLLTIALMLLTLVVLLIILTFINENSKKQVKQESKADSINPNYINDYYVKHGYLKFIQSNNNELTKTETMQKEIVATNCSEMETLSGEHNTSIYGVKLDNSQLQFIEKCKQEGRAGCSLTINNRQIYLSFYKNSNQK